MSHGAKQKKKNAKAARKAIAAKRAAYVEQLRGAADLYHLGGDLLGNPRLHSRAEAMSLMAAATEVGRCGPRTASPGYEPSAWMREAVSKAVERAEEGIRRGEYHHLGKAPIERSVAVAYLGGFTLGEVVGTDEDFTCDRCRTFCPDGLVSGEMVTALSTGQTLLLNVGLCDECHAKEVAS